MSDESLFGIFSCPVFTETKSSLVTVFNSGLCLFNSLCLHGRQEGHIYDHFTSEMFCDEQVKHLIKSKNKNILLFELFVARCPLHDVHSLIYYC